MRWISPPLWVALGFAGQFLFGSRFVVQWWCSERRGEVVVPRTFWWLSMAGGFVLLVYAWHRHDPVFAVGQLLGLGVYVRNLELSRRPGAA